MSPSESERPNEPASNPPAAPVPEPQSATPEPSPPKPEGSPPKPSVSPIRKGISLVLLVVLLAVLGSEIWALYRFNSGVGALERAIEANEAALVEIDEAERLLGHSGDGPLEPTTSRQLKKTYTWSGPIRTHSVAVYYSDGATRGVIRYAIEGAETVPAKQPPTEQPTRPQSPMEQPPTERPRGPQPGQQPPTEEPPTEEPPTEEPPTEEPPTEEPPVE